MNLNFNDFQKQDVKFDIAELKKAYNDVLAIRGFTGVDGISNFGAISLTQIPGDQTHKVTKLESILDKARLIWKRSNERCNDK